MRAVLYTEDMFPITVLDVPEQWWEWLKERGHVRVAVVEQPKLRPLPDLDHEAIWSVPYQTRHVDIRAEVLIKNGKRHMLLFTRSEDEALLLEATFLPGQLREISDIRRREFSKGFFAALNDQW